MKKLLFFAVAVGLIALVWWSQTVSYHQRGEHRYDVLSLPAKEVLVGICWPFSVNRDGMKDGLQLALEEINAGRLAGGYALRLVMRDDEMNEKKAQRIAKEFAGTAGMSAVIGYYDDEPARRASTIFESSQLLHLITGANNTPMTMHDFQYIVRTILSSEKIARSLARMTVNRGYRRVAVLWEEDAFGEDLAHQYRVGLDNLNAELVYQWSYARERADFRRPVNELKRVDADVIFFAGIEPWAGDFLRTARGVGLKTPIIGAFSDTPEMRRRAGQALEDAMFYMEYNLHSESPENQAFVRKFRARYQRDPDTWAAQGYDALHILAKAVKFTGSRNPLDLSYAIRYMEGWEGANGRYKFDSSGELEDKPIYLNKFIKGKPVLIKDDGSLAKPVS